MLWLILIPVIGLLGIVGLMGIVHALELRAWSSNELPFEQKVWLAEVESRERDPMRLRMVDDLLKNHDITGLTRQEVETLLGPPTQTSYFYSWDMVYWLGPERGGIRIDSEWLAIKLDPAGVVTHRQLVRD